MTASRLSTLIPALLAAWSVVACAAAPRTDYPTARRGDVVDRIHGVDVPDPYRLMEEMEQPEVQAWVRAQDELARQFASGTDRDALRDRIAAIARVERYRAPQARGGRHFYLRFPAAGPGPGTSLLMRVTEDGPDRELIGPSSLPEDAGLVRAVPDPSGRRVAYLITDGGSSWATLHVRDVDSGQDLSDALVGVHGSLSSVAWASDGSGLFYERFDLPEPGAERTAQMTGEGILFHRLGETQEQDRLVFDTPDRPGASLSHSVSDDGRYLVVATTDGATQHNQLHYRDLTRADAPIVPLVSEADAMFRFIGNRGSAFWIWTTLDAPKGRVVSVDLGSPARATWQVLVPEADEAISSWIGATAVGTT